jgi:hypothetical protein
MLDSTGHRFEVVNFCQICACSRKLPVYAPEYGHDGGRLSGEDCGPFIENGHGGLAREHPEISLRYGALFIRLPWPRGYAGHLAVVKPYFPPVFAGSSYAYGGDRLPNFGPKIGQVLWLCPDCVKYLRGKRHIWVLVWDRMSNNRNLTLTRAWNDVVREEREREKTFA